MITAKAFSLAYGGALVCEVTSPPDLCGKKAFVREVVPGEEIEAEIQSEQKNLINAKLLKVLSPSPNRTRPKCPVFGLCGGCDLQHMNIAAQRQAKREMVESMLLRQGKISPVHGVSLIGQDLPEYGYRRRIGLHIDSVQNIGFYRSGTGEVVDIESCPLADDKLNLALKKLRMNAGSLSDVAGVTLEEHNSDVAILLELKEETKKISKESLMPILHSFPDVTVSHFGKVVFEQKNQLENSSTATIGRFSQVNEAANSVLIDFILSKIDAGPVTDLYAGSGNFSIPLAQAGHTVDAVEADPILCAAGQAQAKSLGLKNITFHQATCMRYLRNAQLDNCVVLDPPRSGAREVISSLNPSTVNQIIYVSCNLPTLTRDLKELVQAGYELESVSVLDMFPQTHHVETVSVLGA
jgi:23S rRNA (uracil1939-C5)-methyltransferase